MAARVWCMKCKTWIIKEDFYQPNAEALAAHEPRCGDTLFELHPDLSELDAELEKFFGDT